VTTYRPPGELYPFDSHWLDIGGLAMHYLDEGPRDATPVLMLHGNPTWSFYYRDLVLDLRGRYRCIVPDHIGCGLSDKPGDDRYDYRLARRIDDLDCLIDHLAVEQPLTLIVHDWGGMIGLGWAVRHPERIARLVILNTAAFRLPPGKRLPMALWLAGRTRLGALLVRGLNAFSAAAAHIAFKRPVDKAVRNAYTGPYDSWSNRIATLRFVQDIPLREDDPGHDILVDTEARLAQFADKPALIAWGLQDFVFDERILHEWRKRLPAARILRLPDCGHYVLEDAGADLRQAIAAFLDADTEGADG
jgi:haloalkane dehalogenase